MGAFGVHVFEEDMACDALAYATNYFTEEPFSRIKKTLEEVLELEYLEIDDAAPVLVYSFFLIGLQNKKLIDEMSDEELGLPYRENVEKFIAQHQAEWDSFDGKKELIQLNKRCFVPILDESKSESRELWGETGYLQDWIDVVKGLEKKLEEI